MKKLIFFSLLVQCAGFAGAQGTWTQKQNFTTGRLAAATFDINGKGYLVGGLISTGGLNDTWEYSSNAWTQKANFPGGQRGAMFSFSSGGKGYCGLGGDGISTAYHNIYEFDPVANTWTQKANFPGATVYAMSYMTYNGKGYFSNGLDSGQTTPLNETYEYDPATNAWAAKANFPGALRFATGSFSIGTKGYSCCGFTGTSALNEFWEYDLVNDTWTQKANYPGSARMGGVGFTIGLNGYYGLGLDINNFVELSDLYRYNQASNTWMPMASLTDTGNVFRAAFVLNGKGYVVGGETAGGSYVSSVWEFNPPASSGIEENSMGDLTLQVFPNPLTTSSLVTLHGEVLAKEMNVLIFDASGKLVKKEVMRTANLLIEKGSLEAGVYFIKVEAGGKLLAATKFLVQ